VYDGITDLDWPGVKRRLAERLMAGGEGGDRADQHF
jgi:hypothetical protein